MNLICNKIFLEHETGSHPENKNRLLSLGKLKETKIENGEEFLKLVHSEEHISRVKKASCEEIPLDADTLTSKGSYKAACYAAGAAILASETNNFALVRPPGHHSHQSRAAGFCLFNNIAIAAQNLISKRKRVCIIDIDGHHGDGTQDIFYGTDKVLYVSLHQYPAYPGTGWLNETGEGKGKGFNLNIPLPPETSDDLYLEAFKEIALPKAVEFSPDIVGISAGFDAHKDDPLLQMKLTSNTYYKIASLLSKSFRNIFAVLEGGYNLEALPKCIFNFLDGINLCQMRYKEEETASGIQVKNECKRRMKMIKQENFQ